MAPRSPRVDSRIIPYLYVDDVSAYLAFLTRAFGFETRMHHADPDDADHVHAEAALGDAVVMLGRANPKWGTLAPRKLPGLHSGIFVYLDDVDGHFQRARAAGAVVESEPADQPWGARMYTARDPEGNQWYFATPH
jgi:uncharacterized glyoxalase superfamily protein PhnB